MKNCNIRKKIKIKKALIMCIENPIMMVYKYILALEGDGNVLSTKSKEKNNGFNSRETERRLFT